MNGGSMVPENVTCPVPNANPVWFGFLNGSGLCPAGLFGVVDLI
jgi:hypothetical protein